MRPGTPEHHTTSADLKGAIDMPQSTAIRETNLPGLIARGKVRDLYDLGDRLMLVATDRLSAFDVVMNEPIPAKGRVLTQLSEFWLKTLPACQPHHLSTIVTDANAQTALPEAYREYADQLVGRTMLCHKANVIPIECVVRGYLIGGGWREYQDSGHVSGIQLPARLPLAAQLDQPIFTPSTKAASGHDEPISFEDACQQIDPDLMHQARRRAIAIYTSAAEYAHQRGIIIADTKFEFGVVGGELILIDEVLTPDSSRFWPADAWQPGKNPPSYDKQFVRDYLLTLDWQRQPPPPPLPDEVVQGTAEKYVEVFEQLTGSRVL
jgi:phosphoribosylaminoimidazole-succinocarboxamide synthase